MGEKQDLFKDKTKDSEIITKEIINECIEDAIENEKLKEN